MTDTLDALVEQVTSQLASDAHVVECELLAGMRLRLDEDYAALQAAIGHEDSLEESFARQRQEAKEAVESARTRYRHMQEMCTALNMLGLRGNVWEQEETVDD